MKPKRYFIETWGCQMNELDTQRMAGQLMEQGILPTRDEREADLVLLNSCSVREKAAQKAYSRLGRFRKLKETRPHMMVGFCGCVAQQEGEAALKRIPDLDFVLGPARVSDLKEVIHKRLMGERVVAVGFPQDRIYDFDTVARDGYKGMVTIIEGCDKKCTFCIVPSTRGPERCRPLQEILQEVRHLIDFGYQEIELLGQTVNHWREPGGDLDFADLLDAVALLPGLQRLRFITSYPRDFTQRMVESFGRHPNLCPYLHLPVQSGSNRILRLMGRDYTIESYLDLVERLRRVRSDLALSTDLIVGFPGETDEDFRATREMVEEVGFAAFYAFKYSPRPGTAAPRLKLDEVPDVVASARLQELFDVQNPIQLAINQAMVGREMEVMVTGWGKDPSRQTGRTTCHKVVNFSFEEPAVVGECLSVKIDKAFSFSLLGSRVEDQSEFSVKVS